MSEKKPFDVESIKTPSEITEEVLKIMSADDAIYLREKFGDELNDSEQIRRTASSLSEDNVGRLKELAAKYKANKDE